VKALPNPYVLKILLEEGCGLDCSSRTELFLAKMAGCKPEDISYTSNYTNKYDLLNCMNEEVMMNLDDITMVETIKQLGLLPGINMSTFLKCYISI